MVSRTGAAGESRRGLAEQRAGDEGQAAGGKGASDCGVTFNGGQEAEGGL